MSADDYGKLVTTVGFPVVSASWLLWNLTSRLTKSLDLIAEGNNKILSEIVSQTFLLRAALAHLGHPLEELIDGEHAERIAAQKTP